MSASPPGKRVERAGRLVGGPAGFRAWLIRLGPTYVKLGQHLALRPDLIPQAYCEVAPHSTVEERPESGAGLTKDGSITHRR